MPRSCTEKPPASAGGVVTAHPLPEPTTLLVEHREPAEIKDRLRALRNLVLEEVPGIGPGKARSIAEVFGYAAERSTAPAAAAKSRGRSKAPAG